MQAASERFTPLTQRARQKENGIGAAHLGVNRDRLWTRSSDIHKRPSAFERSSEANRAHQRMTYQR